MLEVCMLTTVAFWGSPATEHWVCEQHAASCLMANGSGINPLHPWSCGGAHGSQNCHKHTSAILKGWEMWIRHPRLLWPHHLSLKRTFLVRSWLQTHKTDSDKNRCLNGSQCWINVHCLKRKRDRDRETQREEEYW